MAAVMAEAIPTFAMGGDGLCSTARQPDDFTETARNVEGRAARRRAATICSYCPLKRECLRWGVKHRADGVFGGEWLINGKIQSGRNRA